MVVSPDELNKLIKTHLGLGAETIDGLIALQAEPAAMSRLLEEIADDGSEAAEQAKQASVVRLVNEILVEAVEARTSDVHIEVHNSGIKLRYRIDGVLQRQPTPQKSIDFAMPLLAAEDFGQNEHCGKTRTTRRSDQTADQRREVDVRVSVIPMLFGEGVVLRILDKSKMEFSLKGVGLAGDTYDNFKRLIQLPHGIVLVTGPTGSGKTTTLYSALSEINDEDTKIITTKIRLNTIWRNQSIQVNHKVGMTFCGQSPQYLATRSRCDPGR